MYLQIALDLIEPGQAKKLIDETAKYIDIIEIGTPFIIKNGISVIKEIKETAPGKQILADLKIMDAGAQEANMAFQEGADIVTVLGAAEDATVKNVIAEAKKHHGRVMADLIAVKDIRERAVQIDRMGVDYICVHTAFDMQESGKNPLEELMLVKQCVKNARLAVAGGVNLDTMPAIISLSPEIVIVGGAIANSKDRAAYADKLKRLINGGDTALCSGHM